MLRLARQPQTKEAVVSAEPSPEPMPLEGQNLPRPSLLLYLAGLCVTLSGLYAVNYGSPDIMFTTLTFGLAIGGYVFSYVLRLRRISIQSLHTPLLIVLGLSILAMLSSDRGLGWLAPMGMDEDRARVLQFIFAWLAILHSFLLANDAAVLFACVPCMTMLALVSTKNSDPDVQNAFLIFIGASTFMMVHENYLRTRTAQAQGRSRGREGLFGGQLQLTALCLVGALVLANFVAVPIRSLGQTLFDSGALMQTTQHVQTFRQNLSNALSGASEQDKIEIGAGPVSESDAEIMSVVCDVPGLNWRGKTFATYNGREFENRVSDTRPKAVHYVGDKTDTSAPVANTYASSDASSYGDPHEFVIDTGDYDLPKNKMRQPREVKQKVTILGASVADLYAAGNIIETKTAVPQLVAFPNGEVRTSEPLAKGATFTAISNAPSDDDPAVLRSASSSPEAVPEAIQELYLTTRVWDDKANNWLTENANLRAIAARFTQGATNNYDKVKAIQKNISELCKYNLKAKRVPPGLDTVEYFLTVSHEGYCTDFAAAMTMLCRYAGVPARMASGFLTGDLQDGQYIVRDRHRHVWTEVFFPEIGWVPFDATDGTQDITDRSNKNHARNPSFFSWLFTHGLLPPAIGLLVIGLLAYILKAEILDRLGWQSRSGRHMLDRPPTNIKVVNSYLQACDLLGRKGIPRLEHQTPDEYADLLRHRVGAEPNGVGSIMADLTDLYTQYRYGSGVAQDGDVMAAAQAVANLKRALAELPNSRLSSQPARANG